MQFGFTWTLSGREGMDIKDVTNNHIYSGDRLRFEAAVEILKAGPQKIAVKEMRYQLGSLDSAGLEIGMRRVGAADYKLIARGFKPVTTRGKVPHLSAPAHFYGFPAEVTAGYQNTDFVRDLTLELEQCLHDIYYLGPLRDFPQRSYTWSGENPEHVGVRGELTVDAILAARTRKLMVSSSRQANVFEAIVARWLQEMGLIQQFRVKSMGERRRDYEVLVKTNAACADVNLTDVGFGVSQVLPVIVECFYAPPGSTIIIEQPEVHLHPSVQSSLADLFIEALSARESGQDRSIQLVIESHSEHFLRRLQMRIAQEKIAPEQTALYFCENDTDGSTIAPLEVDEFGNILNWPGDFFGDPIEDLVQMTEATARRIRKRS